MKNILCLVFSVMSLSGVLAWESRAGWVDLIKVPNGGIQPQVVEEEDGTVHLVYYKGEPKSGNLFYVQRAPGEKLFSAPVRVNHRSGSAVAMGTIRGAQIALGRKGLLHVVWNGGPSTHPDGEHAKAPLFYTRTREDRKGFHRERNMITHAWGLDGGSSVAADGAGNVYVVWHASPQGNDKGEAGRTVYVARSDNDGGTFSREESILPEPTGVCGCCGLKAYAETDGRVFVFYRSAGMKRNRDQWLIGSEKGGRDFVALNRHPWPTFTCPMSSSFLVRSSGATLAAWETQKQVYLAGINESSLVMEPLKVPPGQAKRRFPVAARNDKGYTLMAWTEGTGWNQGGDVAWQLFDDKGVPMRESGQVAGVPTWGLVATFVESDGRFVILF